MSKQYEIEKKYLIKEIPFSLDSYPRHKLEQAYLCTDPVIRIRREDDQYILTYKGSGLLIREEYNLPLTKEGYLHLLPKADGNIIRKTRYLIPIKGSSHTIELDVFEEPFSSLILAEVEFNSVEDATLFSAPDWFGKEVTTDTNYHNSTMSKMNLSAE